MGAGGWERWQGTRVAPREPPRPLAGLQPSLLTPLLQEKAKMDENVWCLRMSLCPASLPPGAGRNLNQNNKLKTGW